MPRICSEAENGSSWSPVSVIEDPGNAVCRSEFMGDALVGHTLHGLSGPLHPCSVTPKARARRPLAISLGRARELIPRPLNALRATPAQSANEESCYTKANGFQQEICSAARSSGIRLALPTAKAPDSNFRGQDSAPDIYETPELTDDNSTVPVSLFALVIRLV
jgi:hypothetical protein